LLFWQRHLEHPRRRPRPLRNTPEKPIARLLEERERKERETQERGRKKRERKRRKEERGGRGAKTAANAEAKAGGGRGTPA